MLRLTKAEEEKEKKRKADEEKKKKAMEEQAKKEEEEKKKQEAEERQKLAAAAEASQKVAAPVAPAAVVQVPEVPAAPQREPPKVSVPIVSPVVVAAAPEAIAVVASVSMAGEEKAENVPEVEEIPPPAIEPVISEETAAILDAPPPPPDAAGAFDDFLLNQSSGAATMRKKDLQAQLKEAIRQGDLSALEKIMPNLDATSGTTRISRTLRLGKAMVDRINKGKVISLNLKKAVEDLDRPRMKELLEEAREVDMEVDDVILQARKLCYGMLDVDFRSLQFKRAMEKKDLDKLKSLISLCQEMGSNEEDVTKAKSFLTATAIPRAKSASVFKTEDSQDLTQTFQSLRGLYPLSQFSMLRPPVSNDVLL